MKIKNERLKDYIYENTTPITRSRANSIIVKTLDFSEDYLSVKAEVVGSKTYEVNFYGVQSGMVSSSCTCPFDHGNVCKHKVAVASEIDIFLESNKNDTNPKEEKITLITSSNGVFQISFEDIKNLNLKIGLKYTTAGIFKQGKSELICDAYTENSSIILEIRGDYWSGRPFKITIELLDNKIGLKSQCGCIKYRLCKHQVSALFYIKEYLSHLIMSEEDINIQKNILLAQFGFSLEDKKYENYFDFKQSNIGLEIVPKKEGIIKKTEFDSVKLFSDQISSDEIMLKGELPYLNKKSKSTKKTGIAFAFAFGSIDDEYRPSVSIVPLIGNLKKDGTALSTKIREISFNNYLFESSECNNDDKKMLEKVLYLSEEYLDRINSIEFMTDSFIHNKLQNILPKLENKLVYELINNTYHITRSSLEPISFSTNSAELKFTVYEEEDFFVTEAIIIIDGRSQKLSKARIGYNYLFVVKNDVYYLNKNINFCKTLSFFRESPVIRTVKSDFENFSKKILIPLKEKHEIIYKHRKQMRRKVDKKRFKKQVYLSKLDEFIIIKPVIEYNNQLVQLFGKNQFTKAENNSTTIILRDKEFEDIFEEQLRGLHPAFKNQHNSFLFLNQEEFSEEAWFINAFEFFKENNIEVFGFKNLNLKYNENKPSISITISSDIDWFDVNIAVAFGEQAVSLRDLKKNVINKDKYIRLKDGSIGILPEEWLEKYLHLFRSGEVKKNTIGVSKYQFSVVDVLYEELQNENNLFDNHLKIKEKIANFDRIENVRKPRGLRAELRPYQKEGLKWLNFLDDFKLGGCLADDMGLGKTIQIISFIKHLKAKHKSKKPHLIIVPTSLIFNWNDEVLKFCPSLKILTLTGGKRDKDTSIFNKYDVVLTTYGIVINDIDYLKKYSFNYIILDESQAIKNPNSKRYKAVRVLDAENRLVLTGTPIQNNTFDLYAQMTFVNPGLLGGITHFRNEYSTAIDKNKDKNVAKELKTLIDPFLLRRTKEQVAKELPPKTEQFLYCTMGKEQRKLYEAYKNKYKDYLLGKIEDDGLGKSKMYVLEGLTKLRQICDSPSLLNDDEDYTNESVKIDELIKHITEKTNNHKILIFSQFVKMLALIKNRLDELRINYEYLDGKTKNRQKKVNNFQNNEKVRTFLISLKAGGTGLNLTAADYVYVVDPWWNPAVEAQAIDRCYRIGQNKKVMAYKMICKDTIEEKIVKHQQNKKQVSDDLIQTEDSFVKSLSKESVSELFS